MGKYSVTLSINTGMTYETESNDPEALSEGDLNEFDVLQQLINQLLNGMSTIDWVVEEVQDSEGVPQF